MHTTRRSLLVFAVFFVLAPLAASGANTLKVNAAAALNNTFFGMEVCLDGSSNSVWVAEFNATSNVTVYRGQFWFDPNGISMAPGSRFAHVWVRNAAGLNIGRLQINRNATNSAYRVRYQHRNTAGTFVGTRLNGNGKKFIDIPNAPVLITFEATIGGAGVGFIKATVDDGTTTTTHFRGPFGNVVNGPIDEVRAGARGAGPALLGSVYFDEFVSFRTLSGC